ncbi:hypothetical protein [Methylobacterium sp. J-068]|uniref:hypothetical protein n=1 Tax=Methylobacterium sp. J-068 TaxID=2836649 RepID=UPI001FBB4A65|nr:hypothetical protein [Methylobacterium sp. J-068]MCJ2033163.1 hypothetical protein [Methylobacterium sp. J-068]
MATFARFAAFAPKGQAVPHVPQATRTWGTGREAGNNKQSQLLSHRVPLVPHVPPRNDVPWDEEDWQAAFDERAGILEYDEGLSRLEAEALAREQIDKQRRA